MPGTRQSGVLEGPQQSAAAFASECAEIMATAKAKTNFNQGKITKMGENLATLRKLYNALTFSEFREMRRAANMLPLTNLYLKATRKKLRAERAISKELRVYAEALEEHSARLRDENSELRSFLENENETIASLNERTGHKNLERNSGTRRSPFGVIAEEHPRPINGDAAAILKPPSRPSRS